MLRCAFLTAIGLLAAMGSPSAETASRETPPAASSPALAQSSRTVVPMEEPQPGDYWTYEIRDEITGMMSSTRTNVVTEVTPKEIAVRFKVLESSNSGFSIYDRAWNLISSGSWKYSPNDGRGIQTPLTTGKSWAFRASDINARRGYTWNRSGQSRIVSQESLTTKAGTFDTFKIETTYSRRDAKDPTRKEEVVLLTWHAPAINHYVKRSFILRDSKRLRENTTIELTDYGRRQ
jgi:hypothetical protein